MSLENSSLRCTSNSAARNKISARFGAGTSRHFLYASFSASTAALTSSSVEDTNIPTSSSAFAGLRFSYAFPLRDSTHSPLMKFLKTLGATAVAILPPGIFSIDTLLVALSSAGSNASTTAWKLNSIVALQSRQTHHSKLGAHSCNFAYNPPVLFFAQHRSEE